MGRWLRAGLAVAILTAVVACGAGSSGGTRGAASADQPWTRNGFLHPAHKFVGVAMVGASPSLQRANLFAQQSGRWPAVLEFFLAWSYPLDVGAVQQACAADVMPALTWESWSWAVHRHGETAATQPAYAPRLVAAGRFDGVIRRTATQLAALHCAVLLRFDQEPNGRWYPWGLTTRGMGNHAADYVAMWRHVWQIFHSVGATNVIWVWSPNLLYKGGVDSLASLYPGDQYVDAVGIDGYLYSSTDTPQVIFDPVQKRLATIVPNKPWFIAETGVAPGPLQASRVTALLQYVATAPKLNGMVYLDGSSGRADWTLRSPSALAALRSGVALPAYGTGQVA